MPGALGVTAKRPVSRGGCRGLAGSAMVDVVVVVVRSGTESGKFEIKIARALSFMLRVELTFVVSYMELLYLNRSSVTTRREDKRVVRTANRANLYIVLPLTPPKVQSRGFQRLTFLMQTWQEKR